MTGALAIGLHHDAETVPAFEPRIGEHRLDDIQRQIEPVGLLGIDVETHIGAARHQGQRQRALDQLVHYPLALGEFVARMQRRELDRDPWIVAHIAGRGARRQHRDGFRIGGAIALGIGLGAGRLAQHVVRIRIALALHPAGDLGRLLDGAAEDELAAEDLHRLQHRRTDHGLADALHEALDGPGNAGSSIAQHFAGEGQRQGGDVDQRRIGQVEMLGPVARSDLVLDQVVHGFGIGHAQQRLGEAHQRDALVGRERVFGEEAFEHPARRTGAHLLDELGGPHPDGGTIVRMQRRVVDQAIERGSLVGKRCSANGLPQLGQTVL